MATAFARAMIQFTADGGPLLKQLAGIQRAVGQAGDQMAATFHRAMVGIGVAIAAAIGPAALVLMTKATADAGDELNKLSQRVGIGVEDLSGYKVAAELADVSLQDLGKSLQLASRNIVEASRGTGTAVEAFDALGISVTDQSGKLKSAEQVMLEVADRFATMEDGTQKTALALEIFGRSGAAMIPLLNQGSAAIQAQREEARLLGATWTTAQAQQAEAFNDNLTRIETAMAGFRNAVINGILPFLNQVLTALIDKIKEWSASGDLQAWAVAASEAIVEGFVWAAQGLAQVARVVGVLVDAFRLLMMVARMVESGFETLIGTLLSGFSFVLDKVTDLAELLNLPNAQGLREMQQVSEEWASTFHTAASQAGEAAFEWWESVGKGSAGAEKFAAGIDQIAVKFRQWADQSKAAAAGTLAATGEAAKKTGDVVYKSSKEMVKALDESFKALSTRGEVSLQEQLDYLQKRASLYRAGTAERQQAEADAFKFAQTMTERLFAHEQALGLKSLQEEIAFQQQKAAAAKEGSEARMKAEETAYAKEEELRNKSRTAALGLLGEVQERLKAKGITTVTQADVQRELGEMQLERGRQFAETAGRFAAGGAVDIGALMQGIQAGGKLEDLQKTLGQFGGVPGLFGASVRLAPAAAEAAGLGVTDQTLRDLFAAGRPELAQQFLAQLGGMSPETAAGATFLAGTGTGVTTEMDTAYAALDAGLTRMEDRVQQSGSRIRTTIFQNLEGWFVDKLMRESARA